MVIASHESYIRLIKPPALKLLEGLNVEKNKARLQTVSAPLT